MEATESIVMMAALDPDGFLIGPYVRTGVIVFTLFVLSVLAAYGLQRPTLPAHVARGGADGALIHRKYAVGVAAGLFAAGCALAWWMTWTDFKGVEAQREQLVLHYYMPHRTVVVPRSAVKRITLVHGGKFNYSIVVRTQDDTQYRGATISGRSFVGTFNDSGLAEWPSSR